MTLDVRTAPAPVETVTPIKPSEALRLGRLTYPERSSGKFYDGNGGACAIGAIAKGWASDLIWTCRALSHVRALDIETIFDEAENAGQDGDAAVLAYLESRGL